MRSTTLGILLAVTVVPASSLAENLVRNPSVEEIGAAGKPLGWGHYENTPDHWGASDKEFFTGRRCAFLKITGFDADGYACTDLGAGETDGYTAPNGIPVKPNTRYHFSFYLAGYGFKRNLAVAPWGFRADGSGRDRSMAGVSVLPSPEWKRYTGTFTTKAETQRVVLMFFVYGLQERDVDEGAAFYVDEVYLGTEEPPAPLAATGRAQVETPRPGSVAKGEGYRPLRTGTVRLWDANKKYTMKHYDMRAWQDRANWSQVPYGTTAHPLRGDWLLEGENFWISLHSSRHDSVFLYAQTDADATPGRHNELYRVFDTPNGRRNYGSGSESCRVLKNTPEEILVESKALAHERGGFLTAVTTRYRLRGGRPWVEIQPVSQADEQGMHGESRFVLAPEAGPDGTDFVEDSLKKPGEYVSRVPDGAKMLLDLIMDDDTIWVLTCPRMPEGTRLNWPGSRFYAGNAPGGWHAGWSRIGEGECDRVWSDSFALFTGQPVYVGVLRIGYWHYQKVGASVKAGVPYTGKWKWVYERPITSSPFQRGEPWRPLYPGKWRLVGCVDGKFYTNEVAVTDTTRDDFRFTSPASGTLQYLLFYLYDRTDQTPKQVWTPLDIYREAVER